MNNSWEAICPQREIFKKVVLSKPSSNVFASVCTRVDLQALDTPKLHASHSIARRWPRGYHMYYQREDPSPPHVFMCGLPIFVSIVQQWATVVSQLDRQIHLIHLIPRISFGSPFSTSS